MTLLLNRPYVLDSTFPSDQFHSGRINGNSSTEISSMYYDLTATIMFNGENQKVRPD